MRGRRRLEDRLVDFSGRREKLRGGTLVARIFFLSDFREYRKKIQRNVRGSLKRKKKGDSKEIFLRASSRFCKWNF